MANPLDEHELRNCLAAFADGELDLDQTLRVLQQMAMDPQATRRAVHQQQLRQAVSKSMAQPTAPAALKQCIEALVAATPKQDVAPAATAPIARIGGNAASASSALRRWSPLALAAMLFIAALVTLGLGFGRAEAQGLHLSAAQLAAFNKQHKVCTRNPNSLHHADTFPKEVKQLPEVAIQFIGVRPGDVDLSTVGYQYVGAGECNAPGKNAVHLIYESTDPSQLGERLSLWIVKDTGEYDLKPGKVYTIDETGGSSMVMWRRGDVLYYLMGDLAAQPQVNLAAYRLLARAE